MPAKPVIDILVALASVIEARRNLVGPMEALGYAFWADNPRLDRLFFVRGLPPASARRTHHVHMAEPGGAMWRRLAFSDHLRTHPGDAAGYAALKLELAARHRTDREVYTDAKSDFVDAVMQRVGG